MKSFKKIVVSLMAIITVFVSILQYSQAVETVDPGSNQFLQLKATTIVENVGGAKQVVMELWGYDIDFKGFDVRFKYDKTKFSTSNLTSNIATTDVLEYFKLENEFAASMDYFTVACDDDNTIDLVVSFNPPVTESEHIKNESGTGYIVKTTGGVLLGKMSFRMSADEFDISGFELVTSTSSSPRTGIKISKSLTECYENQSTFRFLDATASKNAYLSNITVSYGDVNEEDETLSTYKEYALSPTFDKDTLSYDVTIVDLIDSIKVKPKVEDTKSSIKMKIAKRDDDGALIYDSGGTDLVYEEIEVTDDTDKEILLNDLSAPETKITIIVTAEDGKTTKEYVITIKRPLGTLEGSIVTPPTADLNKHYSPIKVYKYDEVAALVDFDDTKAYSTIRQKLLTLTSLNYETKLDGTYSVHLPPGKYTVLFDKEGYLDYVFKEITIEEKKVVTKDPITLTAGDLNKDGEIQIKDVTEEQSVYGSKSDTPKYKIMYDFNEDGEIQIKDFTLITSSYNRK